MDTKDSEEPKVEDSVMERRLKLSNTLIAIAMLAKTPVREYPAEPHKSDSSDGGVSEEHPSTS